MPTARRQGTTRTVVLDGNRVRRAIHAISAYPIMTDCVLPGSLFLRRSVIWVAHASSSAIRRTTSQAADPELLGLPFEALCLPPDRLLATLAPVVTVRRPVGVPAPEWAPLASPIKVMRSCSEISNECNEQDRCSHAGDAGIVQSVSRPAGHAGGRGFIARGLHPSHLPSSPHRGHVRLAWLYLREYSLL
jgi:hypothetical protein